MTYDVRILRSAEKDVDDLPRPIHRRITERILSLDTNPRPRGCKRLTNREEYRIRVGTYRILYIVDDKRQTVTIVAVGHRREAYH